MVYRPEVRNDLCFVLLPLRSPFIGYFEQLIKPAAAAVGLVAIKADDIYGTRAVIRDIWEQIWHARVIVAIVSGKNPNVNYELGICHALGIPTVLLTDKQEDVPFDYRHRRYIRYKTEEAGWEQKLRDTLTATLRSVLVSVPSDDELAWPYDTYVWKEPKRIGSLASSEDSLDVVLEGVDLVHKAVSMAFGPLGSQVSVLTATGPNAYRRGIFIAQGIRSSDPLQRQGIEQMQRLASEMRNSVGDGTKTAILLAQAMLKDSHKALKKGLLPRDIVIGMRSATEAVAGHILTRAKPCDTASLSQIATTASGNQMIASLVVDAMKKLGKDGVITVQETKDEDSTLEVQEGLQFDCGFISHTFATDKIRQECVLQDCHVLIYEPAIKTIRNLLPLLEVVVKTGKPILIISADVEGEALATLVLNNERGIIKCAAVKSPGYGDRRQAALEDIAVLTGARPFISERIIPLESIRLEDLGSANKVTVTRDSTTILGGGGNADLIAERVQNLRHQIEQTRSDFDREKLQERLAKLASGIAVIRIGGLTSADRSEATYRVESAMFSTHAAIENGYVIGGGNEYVRAQSLLEKLVAKNAGEQAGIQAVASALEKPTLELLTNSRVSNANEILRSIKSASTYDIGFNADRATVEDLREAGVVDAAKTLHEALRLAFSHVKGIIQTAAWDLTSSDQAQPETDHIFEPSFDQSFPPLKNSAEEESMKELMENSVPNSPKKDPK